MKLTEHLKSLANMQYALLMENIDLCFEFPTMKLNQRVTNNAKFMADWIGWVGCFVTKLDLVKISQFCSEFFLFDRAKLFQNLYI